MKRRARLAPDHGQRAAALSRHWITLPGAVRRAARQRRVVAGLFPSHVGFLARARLRRVDHAAIEPTMVTYCVKGAGLWELAGRRHEFTPGDVRVVPSGEPHVYGAGPD